MQSARRSSHTACTSPVTLKIVVSEGAEADQRSTAFWYDRQAPGLGDRFLAEIERIYDYLIEYPEACQLMPEGVRRALVHHFPYQVIYMLRADDLVIVAIFHCHVDPAHIAERLS